METPGVMLKRKKVQLAEQPVREVLAMDDALLSERIQIERKQFFFDLKENPQGRFLKITEDVGGRRNTIIIPSTGLDSFRDTVQKAIDANKTNGD